MQLFLNILYAILIFGVLIFVHEMGHFLAAKTVGVKVNGFSLGLGPRLCGVKIGETDFSLRLLPVGGACMMEGEDEDSVEPRAFGNKPIWARFIVLVAGSLMNFLFGFVVIIVLLLPSDRLVTTTVESFPAELGSSNAGVLVGDELYEINGERVYTSDNIAFLFQRYQGEPYTVTVIRDGQKVTLENVEIAPRTFEGSDQLRYGFNMGTKEAGFFDKVGYGIDIARDYVRTIRMSLADLFKGNAGVDDLTGPIGITATMSQVDSGRTLWAFAAFIAINLAVMNLLPLPALDGGRVLFLLIELVLKPFGKRLDSKYENYIHLAGLLLFLLLMVYVGYNDVARLIG
ncbi:MAG: RIP metalloprotease RseP [Ruminococcaceae bacterium]|nr:RIP metalloprotease RseP [Oscillospiraceae bacterium]